MYFDDYQQVELEMYYKTIEHFQMLFIDRRLYIKTCQCSLISHERQTVPQSR